MAAREDDAGHDRDFTLRRLRREMIVADCLSGLHGFASLYSVVVPYPRSDDLDAAWLDFPNN